MKTTTIFKPLSFALIIFSFVALFSCDSDDDGGPDNPSNDIVGIWDVTSLNFSANADGMPLTGEVINLDEINAKLNFKANGELTSSSDSGYQLELTAAGQSFVIPVDPFTGAGTWVKTGSTLTITDEEGTSVFQIESLTSSKLVLKGNEAPGGNGEGEYTDVDYTMVLNR
ncbi:lipocalin-like protein [Winogradskyella epiphytica]|uniref:Lipocalin-like protein n=1 Tax=Winogradskyella epiphytica TaxID=262005 RepID=A0A2V4XEG4_9FLAO|nr:lipocalin family protein [Winogradskyella epiphytica]PYE80974.1 lipocalin-like protein [Winogradskyella epiphytica]GGW65920.1 hypothetical protein GCM10008085_17170 [Winogradskyella epiphytica]